MNGMPKTPENLVKFLREAARYFSNRDTGGEDRAYWSNVFNAENCVAAADLIEVAYMKNEKAPEVIKSD